VGKKLTAKQLREFERLVDDVSATGFDNARRVIGRTKMKAFMLIRLTHTNAETY
jgi:hypothetical protein